MNCGERRYKIYHRSSDIILFNFGSLPNILHYITNLLLALHYLAKFKCSNIHLCSAVTQFKNGEKSTTNSKLLRNIDYILTYYTVRFQYMCMQINYCTF